MNIHQFRSIPVHSSSDFSLSRASNLSLWSKMGQSGGKGGVGHAASCVVGCSRLCGGMQQVVWRDAAGCVGMSYWWDDQSVKGSWEMIVAFTLCHSSTERQCSVFLSVFERFWRYWTDMLHFTGRFHANFRLISGWIEPLRVGGYAPFSPTICCNIYRNRILAFSHYSLVHRRRKCLHS